MRKRALLGGLTVASLVALSACGGNNNAVTPTNSGSSGTSGSGGSSGSSSHTHTSSSSGGVFTTIDEAHAITAGAPMNPYNPKGNVFDGYDEYNLGFTENSSSNPNASYPGIAASWKSTKGGLVVNIQPKADWSNGKPVTADDIKTSTAVAFAEDTEPTSLASVTVLGPKQIRFNEKKGAADTQFVSELMTLIVVPTSVYGSQLPGNIWSTITASEGTGAAAKKATATLTTLGKKIADFAPSTDVSCGPFVLSRLNSGEALLVKNPHFYAASNVGPSEVVMLNYSGNQEIWNYQEAGRLDAAPYTSMGTTVLKQILAKKGNEKVVSPSFVASSLAFNEKDYPYGITKVRQALAYALDRPAINAVGEPVSGMPAKTQTGVIDSIVPDWLTTSQQANLNPYNYNLAKATSLLESAGFKKQNGKWIMPNGKAWDMTIEAVNGFSDWIAADQYMASKLTSFGINASTAEAADYATDLEKIDAGNYAVGFWLNALGPSVSSAYARVWGSNLSGGSTPTGDRSQSFLHTPASLPVKGFGTVQLNKVTNGLPELGGAALKKAVAELAMAYNQELPEITLWDYENVQFVNTTRFTDFPTSGGLLSNPPGVWMAMGYVKAK